MSLIQALILAIIEGVTEFLPVSSTGHMIVASSLMGIAGEDFTKLFTIAIQFGAILSVIVLYYKRFFQSIDFYLKLGIAFIPAAVFGKLLNKYIDALLENVTVVGCTLLAGGILFLFIDKWFIRNEDPQNTRRLSYASALKVGLFQVISMIPGVSRSAATIIGGLAQGMNRKDAAEFSFFLAVPTMFAATVYKLYDYHKSGGSLGMENAGILLAGNVIAFVIAMLAIKFLIGFLARNGFRLFGYYRIAAGLLILLLHYLGIQLTII